MTITAGNTSPTVTINTPVDGDFFDWGQSIPYTVTVTDPEDGAIDCNRVQSRSCSCTTSTGTRSRRRTAAPA